MQCCWTVFGHLLKISFEEFRAIDLCGNAATRHACFWNPPRAERRSSCGILVYNRQEKSSEMKWSEINFLRGRAWLPFRTSAHIAWSYRTICPKTVGGCKFPIPVSVPSWALQPKPQAKLAGSVGDPSLSFLFFGNLALHRARWIHVHIIDFSQ